MLMTDTDREIASAHASKAIASGDLRKAERWLHLVERDLAVRERAARREDDVLAVEAAKLRIADAARREQLQHATLDEIMERAGARRVEVKR